MSQFSTEELNLLLHAVDAYARTMNTREEHVGPACRLTNKLCDLGADYTGPIPERVPLTFGCVLHCSRDPKPHEGECVIAPESDV